MILFSEKINSNIACPEARGVLCSWSSNGPVILALKMANMTPIQFAGD
jgi:hypothetical protein